MLVASRDGSFTSTICIHFCPSRRAARELCRRRCCRHRQSFAFLPNWLLQLKSRRQWRPSPFRAHVYCHLQARATETYWPAEPLAGHNRAGTRVAVHLRTFEPPPAASRHLCVFVRPRARARYFLFAARPLHVSRTQLRVFRSTERALSCPPPGWPARARGRPRPATRARYNSSAPIEHEAGSLPAGRPPHRRKTSRPGGGSGLASLMGRETGPPRRQVLKVKLPGR